MKIEDFENIRKLMDERERLCRVVKGKVNTIEVSIDNNGCPGFHQGSFSYTIILESFAKALDSITKELQSLGVEV